MQGKNYTIRAMNCKEIDMAIDWAAAEGWNPGLHDGDGYYVADPRGFFVGLLGLEPIATISAVKYGETFGFLGFYMVRPEYRGQGYGIQIWNAALKYLEGRVVGLDGVIAQQENYKKSGFKLAYRNIRYAGTGNCPPPSAADIVALSSLPFERIDSYDRAFFPDDRSRFIKSWIGQPESHGLGIMQDGQLCGYGVIRKCREGYKIGPLFADSPDLADSLFLALRSMAEPTAPVFLDVPEVNQAAVDLAERHGMQISFETARMYLGNAPDMPLDRTFGVTSFEIG